MKKFNKKIALILVLTLILAASIPALAASSTIIMGQYEEPVLSVVIPASGEITLNPLGLPVTLYAEDGKTVLGKLNDPGQIATKALIGYSLCEEVDLEVHASVIGEAKGDFKFSADAITSSDDAKLGQVCLQVTNPGKDGNAYTLSLDTNPALSSSVCTGVNGLKALGALNDWNKAAYTGANNEILIGTTANKNDPDTPLCTLDKATDAKTPSANGYFMARLGGELVKSPKIAWAARDGIKATVTWTIQPVATP